jgi:SAM-dependent methyltransferase
MSDAEFDKYADEYASLHARNIRISGEDPEFFARYKTEDVAQVLQAQRREPAGILDFGAGIGASVPHWRRLWPRSNLVCVDVSERSLELARRRQADQAQFHLYDGRNIPFPDRHFDVVFAACVFHHIEVAEHVRLLAELRRVLAPDGTLFVFEHNPLNPLTVRAFNTCEFDEDAALIYAGALRRRVREAGFQRISVAYRIFFPSALKALRPLERLLGWLPLGAQYRLTAER